MEIVLDSGPAGLITNPKVSPESTACKSWMQSLLSKGHKLILPEIIDYELRRELMRANKWHGIWRLDALRDYVIYLPLDTASMVKAAEFWSGVRQRGKSTAKNVALDIDVILAAQAWVHEQSNPGVIIATGNRKHLSEFLPAEHWKNIHPI